MFLAGEGFRERREAAILAAILARLDDPQEREPFLRRVEAWARRIMEMPYISDGEKRWFEGRLRQARLPAPELRALLLDPGPEGVEARHASFLGAGLSREEIRACEAIARRGAPAAGARPSLTRSPG